MECLIFYPYFILFYFLRKLPCDIPFQIKRLKKWGSLAFQAQNFNLTIQGEYGILGQNLYRQ
jgi:hypothetical protein